MGYQRRVHGDHYSSVTQWVVIINMQSILIASCLAAAAMADADAFYGYGNALDGPSGISAAWPTAVGYGHQSTVYGARGHYLGKRSADADAFYGAYGNAIVDPAASPLPGPLLSATATRPPSMEPVDMVLSATMARGALMPTTATDMVLPTATALESPTTTSTPATTATTTPPVCPDAPSLP